MTRGARIAVRVGLAIFGIGLLLVAFVAYQLWGTALYEAQAQSHLKSELATQLHHALPSSAVDLTGTQRLGLPPLAHQTATPSPEPALGQPVGLLSIPKIGILDAIVEGVGEAQLEQGPGHYQGTALPGQPGNVAIAGHRTTYAHPFYNLDALAPGDNIYILTSQGLFEYTVTNSQVVPPTDVAVLGSVSGKNTLTLTTCNPRYSASTRLVVTANFDGHYRARSDDDLDDPTEGDPARRRVHWLVARRRKHAVDVSDPVGPADARHRRGGLSPVALDEATSPAIRRRRRVHPAVVVVAARVLRAREPRVARELLTQRSDCANLLGHLFARWLGRNATGRRH